MYRSIHYCAAKVKRGVQGIDRRWLASTCRRIQSERPAPKNRAKRIAIGRAAEVVCTATPERPVGGRFGRRFPEAQTVLFRRRARPVPTFLHGSSELPAFIAAPRRAFMPLRCRRTRSKRLRPRAAPCDQAHRGAHRTAQHDSQAIVATIFLENDSREDDQWFGKRLIHENLASPASRPPPSVRRATSSTPTNCAWSAEPAADGEHARAALGAGSMLPLRVAPAACEAEARGAERATSGVIIPGRSPAFRFIQEHSA